MLRGARSASGQFALLLAGLFLIAHWLPSRETPPAPPRATGDQLRLFDSEPLIAVRLAQIRGSQTLTLDAQPLVLITADGTRTLPSAPMSLTFRGDQGYAAGVPLAPGDAIAAPAGSELIFEGRRYPGRFHLRTKGQVRGLVCVVPLESYLEGVIAAEMGASQPLAALEVQAVCARSYACRRIHRAPDAPWHVDTSQRTQVWRGWPSRRRGTKAAVAATRGLVLIWQRRILDAVYSSTCGGTTRDAGEAFGGTSVPPLSGVECGGFCEHSPRYEWEATVSVQRLLQTAGASGSLAGPPRIRKTSSGRLAQLELPLRGGRTATLNGRELRRAVGNKLYSRWIASVRLVGSQLRLSGRGFGHGAGLCQYGTRGRARDGQNAGSILRHYYPGARLAHAWAPQP